MTKTGCFDLCFDDGPVTADVAASTQHYGAMISLGWTHDFGG